MTMYAKLVSGPNSNIRGWDGRSGLIVKPPQFDKLYQYLVAELRSAFDFKVEPLIFINVPTGGNVEKGPQLGYMALEALRQQVESLIAKTSVPEVTDAFQKLQSLKIDVGKGQGEVVRAFMPFRANGYNTALIYEKIIGKISDYFGSGKRSERKECEGIILSNCLSKLEDYYHLSVPLEDSHGKAGFLGIAHFILHHEDIVKLDLIDKEGSLQTDRTIVLDNLIKFQQVVRINVDRIIANSR